MTRCQILIGMVLAMLLVPGVQAARAEEEQAEESPEQGEETYDQAFKDGDFTPDPGVDYAGEVVITGRRIANIEQAGTVTIIDRQDLQSHSDKTLADVLERIPGIQVYTHSKGHQRLRMRGFDQDKVVVLIDGMPLNDVYSTDVNLAAIPLGNVAKIVVNRGVSSALYGSDGAMGTINVITRKPSGPFAEFASEVGSQDQFQHDLSFGVFAGNFYFIGTGSMFRSRGYVPSQRLDARERRKWFDEIMRYELYPVAGPFEADGPYHDFEDVHMPAKDQVIHDDGLWNHQQTRKFQVTGKAGFTSGANLDTGLSAGYYYYTGQTNTYEAYAYSSYRGDRWRPNYPYFADEVNQVKKFALRNRSFVWPHVVRFEIQPYFRGRIGPFSLNAQLFFLQEGQTQDGYASNDHAFTKGDSLLLKDRGNFEPFHDHKTFWSAGFRLLPSVRFARWHRLSMMVHFRAARYLGEESAISPEVSPATYAIMGSGRYPVEDQGGDNLSLAIEDEMRLWNCLKLAVGVSYDAQFQQQIKIRKNETMDTAYVVKDQSALMGTRDSFNPVVGLVWDPIKRRLRLRAAAAMKTRFPTLSEYSKVEEEEMDYRLKPERSTNLNTGAELIFMDRAISLRVDYFMSLITDRIVKFRKDEPPLNVDRLNARGVEAELTVSLGQFGALANLFGSVGYAYVHARYEDVDPAEGSVMGSYVEFTPEHHLSADLLLNYASGLSIETWIVFLANQKIYVMDHRPLDTAAPYSTDYFTTVDLHNPFYLNLRLSQRFAENFEASLTVHNILDDYDMDPFNPGPGRWFMLSLSTRWE